MRWASHVSERASWDEALAECADGVTTALGAGVDPDLVAVFASPHHGGADQQLLDATRARFPGASIVGCSGAGVIGGGHEVEDAPGLSLTVGSLPDVTLRGFHLRGEDLPSADAPPEAWAERTGVPLDADPAFVLLADPFTFDTDALLAGLDYAFPGAVKIGGLASGGSGPGDPQALFLNETAYREGAVGMALFGNVVVDTVVAQGCRPIGEPMRITGAERNVLLSLDGEPPVQKLQELFERCSPRDRELVQRNLFMGIAMDPLLETVQAGDFLIRNVVGMDPQRGVLAVGAQLREGQLVQFHVRDADTSAEDLRLALASYRSAAGDRSPAGVLLFSCTGRGRHLYGQVDHDTGIFDELVGSMPLGGFFCNGEIGPVASTTYLHGYTSSFAIF
ncbi:MAG: FIST C-terminal domain-containing protein, partial [Chloroflexi bacterium]|nr:FIST C-terminal domain-containing protein [Chloroflexota bacterium]